MPIFWNATRLWAKGKPILLMNPPYGERMDKEDIAALYKAVGDTFKKKYKGYECWDYLL
jgi:putative N6-adenine-specific DNA methylase